MLNRAWTARKRAAVDELRPCSEYASIEGARESVGELFSRAVLVQPVARAPARRAVAPANR